MASQQGKALSSQEFSKRLDQLYVRTKVSFDQLEWQTDRSNTKFKNFLNTTTGEKFEALVPGMGRKLSAKASALLSAHAVYNADFIDFGEKYNLLKAALRGGDAKK